MPKQQYSCRDWLRNVYDAAHINLSEPEAVLKWLNLAVLWAIKEVDICTKSATVFGWLVSQLEKDRPVKVRGLGEALKRRRLAIIANTATECGLEATVLLVRSADNKAHSLTRVPQGRPVLASWNPTWYFFRPFIIWAPIEHYIRLTALPRRAYNQKVGSGHGEKLRAMLLN